MTLAPFRIAAAQYEIKPHKSWSDYARKIETRIAEAAAKGAKILVFPEYFSMDLTSLLPETSNKNLADQLAALQDLYPGFQDLFRRAAERHKVYIQAGSFPARADNKRYVNRSWLYAPDHEPRFQDKLQMTRFENEVWGISGGDEIKIFETALGIIGVNICYDSEFPMIARHQVEKGASLILVPSCTDSLAGYYRVRVGCMARALENQCYVAQSPTVGEAPWSQAVDNNVGAAAVYTPSDKGCPDDGILAAGKLNASQWVFADINPALMAEVRADGKVFNHRDWNGQFRVLPK